MNPRLREAVRAFLPRSLKAHRIRRGPLAGQRIVTSWHDYPGAITGSTEAELLNWFARNVKPGETWLDIGAHYGYTGIALANLVGKAGRVVAFEPVAETAGCFSQTREINGLKQLHVVPLGLSSARGIRPVRLPVSRGMADRTLASTQGTGPPPAALSSFRASITSGIPVGRKAVRRRREIRRSGHGTGCAPRHDGHLAPVPPEACRRIPRSSITPKSCNCLPDPATPRNRTRWRNEAYRYKFKTIRATRFSPSDPGTSPFWTGRLRYRKR